MPSLPLPTLREWVEATLPHPLHEWQIILCESLERLAFEPDVKLLLHAPPRVGKSIIVGMRLIPWLLMHHPEWRCPIVTYNIDHSVAFTEVIRDLMRSDIYKQWAPPEAWLENENCSSQKFRTRARAAKRDGDYSVTALGALTGFTGKGADVLVWDDPYASPEDARSEAINDRTYRFHQHQVRLRVGEHAPRVYMYHRYHEDDLGGRVKAEGGFEEIRFPALGDENEDGSDPTGRSEGEPLSDLWSLEHYLGIKDNDPQTFLSMYQGRPRPIEGAVIKREWLKVEPRLPKIDFWVRFWDLASGAESRMKGDYFAGALVGISENQTIWIKDIERLRGEWPDVCEIIADTAERDFRFAQETGAEYVVGVEKVAWQMAMLQDLERTPPFKRIPFWPVVPKGDKLQRALGWIARARHDRFRLLAGDWNQVFINEAIAFNGLGLAHDDQIDGVSGAYGLIWQLRSAQEDPEPIPAGSVAYYRDQAQRQGLDTWEEPSEDVEYHFD